MSTKKQKIIIDTDPGVDDALAIAFGIKAGLPIESICTIYGNSTVNNCTANAIAILELIKSDIPVYQGLGQPIMGEGTIAHSHGDNGLGGFTIESNLSPSTKSAVDHYVEILNQTEDNITIVAIGPTTNIGNLIKKFPNLVHRAQKIVIMGGVFGEKGNITPYAEFNVFNDPQSLKTILESGHKEIIIVPANICRLVTFSQDVFDQIINKKIADGLGRISRMYIDYYSKDDEYGGFNGGVMYDLLAVTLLTNPELFRLEEAMVTVETEDQKRFGLTEKIAGGKNCQLVVDVNSQALKAKYIEVMNS